MTALPERHQMAAFEELARSHLTPLARRRYSGRRKG